jgi:hypothetical protein
METSKGPRDAGPGYETRDANTRSLVIFGVGLFAILALVMILMAVVFRFFSRTQSLGAPPSPFADIRTLPPQPRLQAEPRTDLERLRQREDETLHSYGWVDPKAGAVRIPIDRAMELVLQKGLPVREKQAEKK